jgi:hypothetical protein
LGYWFWMADGVLLLSAHFRWPTYLDHPGWAVLINLAVAGMTLLLLLFWWLASLLFRWRFQFSLRSVAVLIVGIAVPCSWLAKEMQPAKREQDVAVAIEQLGGYVFDSTEAGEAPEPAWLRHLLGDAFFADRFFVQWTGSEVRDAWLPHLMALPRLEGLNVSGGEISDAGLEHIQALTRLRELNLSYTNVTEDGKNRLQRALPKCTIQDDVCVASISGGDGITVVHIENLLESMRGYIPGGSVEWGIQLLREDAKEKGYWIRFGDEGYEQREPTSLVAGSPVAEVLARPEFAEDKPLGRFLRNAGMSCTLSAYPFVASLSVREQEYLAGKGREQLGYDVEITLHQKPDDESHGFMGWYHVWSNGDEIWSRGSNQW